MTILFVVVFLAGYCAGWYARQLKAEHQSLIDAELRSRQEYNQVRDAQYPEMIGKWGKP